MEKRATMILGSLLALILVAELGAMLYVGYEEKKFAELVSNQQDLPEARKLIQRMGNVAFCHKLNWAPVRAKTVTRLHNRYAAIYNNKITSLGISESDALITIQEESFGQFYKQLPDVLGGLAFQAKIDPWVYCAKEHNIFRRSRSGSFG